MHIHILVHHFQVDEISTHTFIRSKYSRFAERARESATCVCREAFPACVGGVFKTINPVNSIVELATKNKGGLANPPIGAPALTEGAS